MPMTDVSDHSSPNHNVPPFQRMRSWYRGLPDKKRYLEFVTAFLSIPVLITVLISNVSNIQNAKKEQITTPVTPAPITIVIPSSGETPRNMPTIPPTSVTPSATPVSCTPGIGPIEIAYPTEGSTVSRDPVCVELQRKSVNYCSVTWSYRLNSGAWSDYSDKQICMYNISGGSKQLDVKVKSAVSGDEILLVRTFTVLGAPVTPTPASQSAAPAQ